MKLTRLLPKVAWTSLILGGLTSILTDTGWLNTPISPDFSQLQEQLGPLNRKFEIEVDPAVLGDCPPERFSFQSVIGPDSQDGVLYIAYYQRGRRWSGRPHDVNVCYRSMGYKETDARLIQTVEGAQLWSRVFENDSRKVRVVHWLQRPGVVPGDESALTSLKMLFSPQGVRQDIASAYFEFDLDGAPTEAQLAAGAQALIEQLEILWH